MKQTMMNTAAGVLAALLLGGAALAQGVSEGYINEEVLRGNHGIQQHPTYHGPTAAEIRAWEQREAEVQARIAHFRATPYWMALAWNFEKQTIAWPGGFRSEQRAIERAKQICSSPNCHVFATFSNTCAVLVKATDNPQDTNDLFVGINPDDEIAAQQAMLACQQVHGDTESRCFYTGTHTGKGLNGTAFCVGYDYSLYNQE